LTVATSGGTALTIDSAGQIDIGSSWKFNANGTGTWGETSNFGGFTWDTGEAIIYAQGSNALVLKPSAADGLSISAAGLATFSNGIAFQSATTGSGTGTGYTLDAYEEGTWTPTQGTFGTWTSPVFTATYVKIGKLVQVNCYQTSGTIDPDGTMKTIGGFPFAVANRASCALTNDSPNLAGHGLIYPGSIMYVKEDIGSQTVFVFSAVYMTA